MKVLGICGSARKLGNSDVLLREALMGAAEAGADTEQVYLADLRIDPCQGCLSCVYRGKCASQDEASVVMEKVYHCDGLILSAPTYLLSPASVMRRLGERGLMLSPHLEQLRSRRRTAGTITVAGNHLWNPLGREMLNQLALILGYQVVDFLEAYAPGPGEVVLDDDLIARARSLGQRVVSAAKENGSRRNPAPTECPVCYSQLFRFHEGGRLSCPVCLAEGELINKNGTWQVHIDPKEHFFELDHRQRHLKEWIIPTRDRYLEKRADIKRKLAKYREQRGNRS